MQTASLALAQPLDLDVLDTDTASILMQSPSEPVRHAAAAWLNALVNARWLGFGESIARKQAAAAWELARTAPYLVDPEDAA